MAKKKKLSRAEAKHICLRYIIGWATEASRTDSDFYKEMPASYVLDKEKLEKVILADRPMEFYYPTKGDIKLMVEEMTKIATKLINEKVKTVKRYEKQNEK